MGPQNAEAVVLSSTWGCPAELADTQGHLDPGRQGRKSHPRALRAWKAPESPYLGHPRTEKDSQLLVRPDWTLRPSVCGKAGDAVADAAALPKEGVRRG